MSNAKLIGGFVVGAVIGGVVATSVSQNEQAPAGSDPAASRNDAVTDAPWSSRLTRRSPAT